MKRPNPAAVLVTVILSVVVLDAGIFVLPSALATSTDRPTPRPSASTSARALPIDPSRAPDAIAAVVPTPSPTPTPTPTPTPSPTPTPTPTPTPKPTARPTPAYRDTVWNARTYVKNRIGSRQYDCVNVIWTKESKWNPRAGTPTGAYGIPQAYPGTKMAAFGSNWRYSPLTQVKWGIWYVNSRYGSACAALDFWESHGWY